jgi:hypothetical protein
MKSRAEQRMIFFIVPFLSSLSLSPSVPLTSTCSVFLLSDASAIDKNVFNCGHTTTRGRRAGGAGEDEG